MDDRNESSRPPRRRRQPGRNRIPLDLSDLNSALPDPHTRRTHAQSRPISFNAQDALRPRRNNQQAAMVTPHPQWAAFQGSRTEQPQQPWASISYTQSTLDKLLLLCHSDKELKREGYVLQDLTDKILLSKMRCTICHARRKGGPKSNKDSPTKSKSTLSISESWSRSDSSPPTKKKTQHGKQGGGTAAWFKVSPKPEPPPLICFYHPGQTLRGHDKVWSCCRQHWTTKGCEGSPSHTFGHESDPAWLANWKYHHAMPTTGAIIPYSDPKAAVALDCEMGISTSGESELIRLTAIDFFTKATLIDQLVAPKVEMRSMNTKYSGVTNAQMSISIARRTCFFGRDAAREALFQYVGPTTVLIMHGGSSDLTALRILHPYIVDSFILEGYYGKKVEGGKSLKNLMKLKTGRNIQNRGKAGHDSLEDALAARELVVRFTEDIPDH